MVSIFIPHTISHKVDQFQKNNFPILSEKAAIVAKGIQGEASKNCVGKGP